MGLEVHMKKWLTALLILTIMLFIVTPKASAAYLSTDDVTYEIIEQTARMHNKKNTLNSKKSWLKCIHPQSTTD